MADGINVTESVVRDVQVFGILCQVEKEVLSYNQIGQRCRPKRNVVG